MRNPHQSQAGGDSMIFMVFCGKEWFMIWLLSLGIALISLLIILIPAFLLYPAVCHGKIKSPRSAMLLLFSLWVLMLFFMTGMPTLDFHTLDFNCNIIPFRGLIDAPIQYGFNVLIFLPIGCFPSLLWAPFSKWKNILWLGFGLSLLIETAQLFTFRTTDIDDLIANTLGTAFGFFVAKGLGSLMQIEVTADQYRSQKEIWFMLATILTVILFQPLLSRVLWTSAIHFLY